MFESGTLDGKGQMEDLVVKKIPNFFFILHHDIGSLNMKFQQIIFALCRIIQVLISFEYTLFIIIPKSLVTLQFLRVLIFQIKAYIQGFQMRYQSFLGH